MKTIVTAFITSLLLLAGSATTAAARDLSPTDQAALSKVFDNQCDEIVEYLPYILVVDGASSLHYSEGVLLAYQIARTEALAVNDTAILTSYFRFLSQFGGWMATNFDPASDQYFFWMGLSRAFEVAIVWTNR